MFASETLLAAYAYVAAMFSQKMVKISQLQKGLKMIAVWQKITNLRKFFNV